jgi:hypothetical protein
MANNKNKKSSLSVDLAAVRGARRERHFAEGGSMVMWKGGVATRIPNKKRIANRTACRKFSIE